MSDNSHKTVLVVEDQDEITENMKGMLVRRSYHVLHATDPVGALTIAEQNPPALILTDLDLPGLEQLMDQLRAHATLKNTPVVVIDINHPQGVTDGVKVLNNFEELDELVATHG